MSEQYDDRRKANQERLDRLLGGLVDSDEADDEPVDVVGVNPWAPTLVGVPEDEAVSPSVPTVPSPATPAVSTAEVPSSPPDWDEDQAAVGDRPAQDAEL